MLRLIDVGNALPSSFEVHPLDKFEPGNIAGFKRINNYIDDKIYCGVSDGISVVGIIDDIRNSLDDSTANSRRMTVWNVKGLVGETDILERPPLPWEQWSSCYRQNTPLFVNNKGELTFIEQASFLKPVAKVKSFSVGGPNVWVKLQFIWLRSK